MQNKRSKRSRIRAAKDTAGHGSQKKNRGAGHRGGRGKSGSGKRGDAKIMKVTKGLRYLGKLGFTSYRKSPITINLETIQRNLITWVEEGKAKKDKTHYLIDLQALGYEKLLSKGRVQYPFKIKISSATEGAIKAVTDAGGEVETNKKE